MAPSLSAVVVQPDRPGPRSTAMAAQPSPLSRPRRGLCINSVGTYRSSLAGLQRLNFCVGSLPTANKSKEERRLVGVGHFKAVPDSASSSWPRHVSFRRKPPETGLAKG